MEQNRCGSQGLLLLRYFSTTASVSLSWPRWTPLSQQTTCLFRAADPQPFRTESACVESAALVPKSTDVDWSKAGYKCLAPYPNLAKAIQAPVLFYKASRISPPFFVRSIFLSNSINLRGVWLPLFVPYPKVFRARSYTHPTGLLCDLLWSDPDRDIIGWGENDRGVSFTFGEDIVRDFLAAHDLDLICRAHQVWM